ncbi:hypothetical protein MYBA111488_17295 [Mycobacterium basiliense]
MGTANGRRTDLAGAGSRALGRRPNSVVVSQFSPAYQLFFVSLDGDRGLDMYLHWV